MPTDASLEPRVLQPRDGDAIWFGDNRMVIKLRAADNGGAYGLLEAWAPPGSGPPLHVHLEGEELFWVLEGRLRIRCGDREFTAVPGACALIPRGVPHTFLVEGSEDARFLVLLSPGGGEEFFASGGRAAEGPGLPPSEPLDMAGLVAAAAQFGTEIIGPPMQPGDLR